MHVTNLQIVNREKGMYTLCCPVILYIFLCYVCSVCHVLTRLERHSSSNCMTGVEENARCTKQPPLSTVFIFPSAFMLILDWSPRPRISLSILFSLQKRFIPASTLSTKPRLPFPSLLLFPPSSHEYLWPEAVCFLIFSFLI